MMKTLLWFVTLGYAAFLFQLSSRAWPQASHLPPFTDKIIHLLLYAPLGGLVAYDLRLAGVEKMRALLGWATLATALYGVSDEVHQYFVPGRTAEMGDCLADALGGYCGALVIRWWIRRRETV